MSELAKRTAVAVCGIPLLILPAVYGSWLIWILSFLLQGMLLYEWRQVQKIRGIHLSAISILPAVVAVNYLILTPFHQWRLSGFLLLLPCLFFIELFRKNKRPAANLGSVLLGAVYISIPLALWIPLVQTDLWHRYDPYGPLVVLLAATWLTDSAAYFTGRAIGRHKLFAAASPNKTVEGFTAAVIASAIVLPLCSLAGIFRLNLLDYVALPVAVGVIGQLGDLLESLFKREASIKDSSGILPGHGGMLDRFDSLLLSTPFFFAYLWIFPG